MRRRVFGGLGSAPEPLVLDGGIYAYPANLHSSGVDINLREWGREPKAGVVESLANSAGRHDTVVAMLPPTDAGDALEFDIARAVLASQPEKESEIYRGVPIGCDGPSFRSALSSVAPVSLTSHVGASTRRIFDRLCYSHSRRAGVLSSRHLTPVLAALNQIQAFGRIKGIVQDPDGAAAWRFTIELPSNLYEALRRDPMSLVPSLLQAVIEGEAEVMSSPPVVADYVEGLMVAADALRADWSRFDTANRLLSDMYTGGLISWPWTAGRSLGPYASRIVAEQAAKVLGRPASDLPFVDYRAAHNPRLVGIHPTDKGLSNCSLTAPAEHLTPPQAFIRDLAHQCVMQAGHQVVELRTIREGPLEGVPMLRHRRSRVPSYDGDRHAPPQLFFSEHEDDFIVAMAASKCLAGDLVAVPGVVRRIMDCGLFSGGRLTEAGIRQLECAIPELTDPEFDTRWRGYIADESSIESALGSLLGAVSARSRNALVAELSESPLVNAHA